MPDTRAPNATFVAYKYPVAVVRHGPTQNSFRIDYYDGSSANLDEGALSETAYVGRGVGTSPNAFGD